MDRVVHQLNTDRPSSADTPSQTLADFSQVPNLILLGDPGAGKTHVFRELAASQGGRYLKARTFLTLPARTLSGQVLYIDGLDEKRSGRADRDTIDAIAAKLFDAAPAKVRLSCRVADWLGDSDLAALSPYMDQQGKAPVLLLAPLSSDEQLAVLASSGLQPGAAERFLSQAQARGLDEFLGNPQSLLMLQTSVGSGTWPETRRELFETSTRILLQEAGTEQARAGAGVYTAEELQPLAGAICVVRLMSDVEGISLRDQEGTPEYPGYRTLSFLDPDKTIAALGRRVFAAAPESECVDYIHRTVAEYLAASFLAAQVRDGLPLGRVMALIAVDGVPAAELRGLHAWLAIHLPEQADFLIDCDPYAVLTYADAAALSPSSCARLIRALANLAANNPWFRQDRSQPSSSVGALARRDMIEEMRTVLRDPEAGPGVRSIVIDALWIGNPIPELIPELTELLAREACSLLERQCALQALLRLGDPGQHAVIAAYQKGLGTSDNTIRIRVEALKALYGKGLGTGDVVALAVEVAARSRTGTGLLWKLEDALPVADLPALLDDIKPPQPRRESEPGPPGRDVGAFYTRMLARVWEASQALEPQRILGWLQTLVTLSDSYERGQNADLREAMRCRPDRTLSIATDAVSGLVPGETWWPCVVRFRELLPELSSVTLLDVVLEHLDKAEPSDARRAMLFELSLILCWQTPQPQACQVFERLTSLAEREPPLALILSRLSTFELPEGYLDGRAERTARSAQERRKQQEEFTHRTASIRSGQDLQWLIHLARIYFALYSDVNAGLTPRDRLADFLGPEAPDIAASGFQAVLSQRVLPTLAHVLELTVSHQHENWWFVLTAGLDEQWAAGRGTGSLSDDALMALTAFDLTNPVICIDKGEQRLVHLWKNALLQNRPELVSKAYLAVVRARLSQGESHVEGFHELLTEAAFEPFRAQLIRELLEDYPGCTAHQLESLLDAACRDMRPQLQIQALAEKFLSGAVPLPEVHRDLWLATAYIIAPARYEGEVEQRARVRREFIFDLRNRSGAARRPREAAPTELPVTVLEFLVRLVGRVYPVTAPPLNGWMGDTNPWDATQYCVSLINRLAAQPGRPAGQALGRLLADADLQSYRAQLQYAIANQKQHRREADYERPDWFHTVQVLANGAPATAADLHALAIDHMRDIAQRIKHENNDPYKEFWNLDPYSRPTSPRPEEACRDVLVGFLRQRLLPLGVTVEPEAHMAEDKRADISMAMPGRKILCELKRDSHENVWTAIESQLERFYTWDPEAKGFGLYGVFWFGERDAGKLPRPPGGQAHPQCAAEMEQRLKELVPPEYKHRIAVFVIDVSKPSS